MAAIIYLIMCGIEFLKHLLYTGAIIVCFISLSVILYNLWKDKERFKILFKTLYIISLPITTVAVLISTIVFVRYCLYGERPDNYVNTWVWLNQSYEDVLRNEKITYKGEEYVMPYKNGYRYYDFSGYTDDDKATPVANLTGGYTVLESVENDLGITMLRIGGAYFLKQEDVDKAISYYENLDSYDFYIYDDGYASYLRIPITFDTEVYKYINTLEESNMPKFNVKQQIGFLDSNDRYYIYARSSDSVYRDTIALYYCKGRLIYRVEEKNGLDDPIYYEIIDDDIKNMVSNAIDQYNIAK